MTEPYQIFRGPTPTTEYLIGNLLLATALDIHGDNVIAVDHEARHLFVKRDERYPQATEEEMTEHCDNYACVTCPIRPRCPMFKRMEETLKY